MSQSRASSGLQKHSRRAAFGAPKNISRLPSAKAVPNGSSSSSRTCPQSGLHTASSWLRCVAVLALLFIISPVLATSDASSPDVSVSITTNSELGSMSEADVATSTDDGFFSSDASSSEESSSDGSDESDGGGIGIVGAFSGISSFTPNSSGAALSLNSSMTSLVWLSQNAASSLFSATTDGDITAACAFYNNDGSIAKAYFGGSFISINSTSAGYVAGVDANGKLDTMFGGVNGPVNALFCDNDTQLVYVGGNFSSTVSGLTTDIATMRSSSTGALAMYNSSKGTWQTLSFHGLDGPVFDFTKMHDSVYAVGAFSATVDNASYVPLDTQPINLSACTITGGNSAETAGFSDPKNIICTSGTDSAGNTWLMRDLLTGFYRIDFPFKTTPTILRLMNTLYQGRGTKAIRIEAAQNNQALTMAYLDPSTNAELFCTQSCPLLQNYDWQAFRFVDSEETLSNITGIIINIVDWFGMGGGFNKIELYERGKYYWDARVYADNTFNGSPCSTQAIMPSSKSTGGWVTTTPASYHGTYLTLTVNKNDLQLESTKNALLTMVPAVPESGFYNVYMTIPGCQNTNTCINRSTAKVAIVMDSIHSLIATVGQHNLVDQEVLIYRGYAPASSTQFSPHLTVSIATDAEVDGQAASVEVVVDNFRFERDTSYTNLNGVLHIYQDQTSPMQLNGPLYYPLSESLPNNTVVYTVTSGFPNLTHAEQTLYLGGQFSSPDGSYSNIVQYSNNSITPLSNTGINGVVHSMTCINGLLYVGGDFDGTSDSRVAARNIAQYNTTSNTWASLGGGTDGKVTTVRPYSPFGSLAVSLRGDFKTLYADDTPGSTNVTVGGLAIWDAIGNMWAGTPYIKNAPTLLFSDRWQDRTNNVALAAGPFSAVAALEANGAVLLDTTPSVQRLGIVGFSLQPDAVGRLVVNSGLWYAKSNDTTPVLVVGGQFQTPGGSTNVAKLEDGKWGKLLNDINGEILTLNNAANLLFIGGVANVTSDNDDDESGFSGLSVYDMDKDKVVGIQSLQGPNGDQQFVRVNKVAIRADTSMVVVGGNFTTAGGMLGCPYICTFDINESQWSPLTSSTLIDQVVDMAFVGGTLFVAGQFKNGTDPLSYIMQYDFDTNSWANISGAQTLPGPVSVLSPTIDGDSPDSVFIIGTMSSNGAPYFAKYDGSSISLQSFSIGAQSTIDSILEVPRSRIPNSVLGSSSSLKRRDESPVPSGYVLMVSGDIYLPSGQRASNAFFYNNQWAPFLSTIQADGTPGYVSSVFYEIPPTNVYQRHRLSVALVILIAIAIALGITFLIVCIGLVYIYLRNRREAAATTSAASAALAAASGGAGAAKMAHGAVGRGITSSEGVAAASGGAISSMAARQDRDIPSHYNNAHGAATRGVWSKNGITGEPVSFDNIAPSTGRLNSGSPAGLAGLAAAGRLAAVSSDTYVHHDEKRGQVSKSGDDDINESLDSIFESAAAEAEAEAESEARERAISSGSMEMAISAAAAAGAGARVGAAASEKYPMPVAQHYNSDGSIVTDPLADQSRANIYRPDSTNPFEQRMALRESQGAFPPAGPFSDGDEGVGHIPMPSPHHMHSEQAAAAALAGGAMASRMAGSENRRRSETTSTRNTDGDFSTSQSPSSRPSAESSTGGSSSTHLPIRDSLKQHPVFYAKFTFSSRETGELGFRAGERVFVIDQSDEIWWMGIVDHGPDQPLEQGVFPATYVSSVPPRSTDWTDLM
ncbi:hypothetical protein IW140_001077 [Coemansia sp. RSA 1813]|nr:hypothetical protein EV178_002304 [Coemansia sp. RSA 1646]KAJ1773110.1 hypothetical protein LPJ74_000849 [Coemansia sp. RSA 1843]KAJ2091987.1 hypothetical protein IW138_001353 [Coemansia sp. RSA 986]KAJ2216676.1 hypothetical protein EV179_001215 [Coemansia sp. RSA 487]KAJ2572037.1 hypothetical protein IW140_001077 [Coemansia sp. RSA 1813]